MEEKAVLDRAIILTYKEFGYTLNGKNKSKKKPEFPLLKDFYKIFKKLKQKDLCNRLERFVFQINVFEIPVNPRTLVGYEGNGEIE